MKPYKVPQKSFDPDSRAYKGRLWVKHLSERNALVYHFFWKRIFIVLGIFSFSAWLAFATATWHSVKYGRGFTEVHYIDFVLPWRSGHYRAAMNARILAQGRQQLDNGNPNAALSFFDALLTLEPANLENRRLAAQAQIQLGFKSDALDILRAGTAQAVKTGDEAYLRSFFSVAFDEGDDNDVFDVAQKLLPAQPDGTAFHRFVALQAATARYNRGHDIEAEQILDGWKLRDTPEGEVLYAYCDADRGLRVSALKNLESDLGRFDQKDAIYLAIERLAREQGLPQVVRLFALLRGIAQPNDPQTRMDLIAADHALGRDADVRQEIDAYCTDFKSNRDALTLLAQFSADAGELDVAERARDLAQAIGGASVDLDLDAAEAGIVAQDYSGALLEVSRAQADSGAAIQDLQTTFDGFNAAAHLCAADAGADLAFADFLPRAGALRPSIGLFLVMQLRRDGFSNESRQLLEQVCAGHPDDQPVLAELIRTEAAAGNRTALIANLPQLLAMRKPPRDVLQAALPSLDPASDAALRAQVTDALGDSAATPTTP